MLNWEPNGHFRSVYIPDLDYLMSLIVTRRQTWMLSGGPYMKPKEFRLEFATKVEALLYAENLFHE